MDQEQIAEWLYDGVMALRQGNKEQAQELLMQVVQADETNEEAWLWLSGAVSDIEDQETALLNVLDLNPNNEYAKQGLKWIKAHKS
jgi:thioredoxin-like negative regulator of GroEL